MPILKRLREYLHENRVDYEVHDHPEAFTAQKVAQTSHVSGWDVAKVVIVKDGEGFLMVVLPAVFNIDMERLGEVLGLANPRLATEDEFEALFPGCELGAMPPFGNLYGVPVAVDRSLTEDEFIICQAGNHHQTVTVAYDDFERLVEPQLIDVGVHV